MRRIARGLSLGERASMRVRVCPTVGPAGFSADCTGPDECTGSEPCVEAVSSVMRESSGVCSMVSFIMLEVRAAFRRTTATLLSPEAKREAALLGEAADLLG